jgi:UDP-N-acetylmuramate dehydrogenase
MAMAATPEGSSTLFADLDVEVELDAPLAGHTWYGIGGHADALVHPRSEEALCTLLRRCARTSTPVRVLGEGANLLVDDRGIDGVVLRLDAPCFTALELNAEGAAGLARVGGGRDLAKTIHDTTRASLGGLEPLIGVPASVGGAIRMNAGGKYGEIGDVVHSVGLVTWGGEPRTYPRDEIRFSYRHTDLPPGVVTWAILALRPADPVALQQRKKEISAYKASVQPLAAHSAGCMFRNPVDPRTGERVSAGLLIDRAGLKGTRIGGASVSDRHGNFIVVEPGARAADVMELAATVADETFARTGIRLEREVVFWRRGEP